MVDIKQSTSTSKSRNQSYYYTESHKISNQPHLKEDMVVREKGKQICLSDETASDYSLDKTATTSASCSRNSSESSANACGEIIFSIDTDIISTNFKDYGKDAQRKPSISELAGKRLHYQAKERSKRMAILVVKKSTDSLKLYHDNAPTVSSTRVGDDGDKGLPRFPHSDLMNGVRSMKKTGKLRLSATESMRSTFDARSSRKKTNIPRHYKNQRRSSVVQMKNVKCIVDPNNTMQQENLSISEIAGCRLHSKAMERNKRLALLRSEYQKQQPKVNLEIIVRSSPLLSKVDRSPSAIQMKNAKSIVDPDNNIEQERLSVSEIAGCRLYLNAIERKKRLTLLKTEYHEVQPKINLEVIARPLSLMSRVDRSSTTVKPIACPDNNIDQERPSISEIAGYRLHSKGIERNERLVLLKNEYHKQQLKLNLETVERNLSLPQTVDYISTPCHIRLYNQAERYRRKSEGLKSKETDILKVTSRCGWNGDEPFQRLYARSKPMQENGRKRRENIVKACEKAKEVWIHPTEKISLADATRLYYIGLRKHITRKERSIEASNPGVHKSHIIPPIQSY